MTRPIDADALRELYNEHIFDTHNDYNFAIDTLDSMPTVDAAPVRYGHWVYDPNGMDWNLPAWRCSECHVKNDNIPAYIRGKDSMVKVTDPLRWAGSKFCPNCGVRMMRWKNEIEHPQENDL